MENQNPPPQQIIVVRQPQRSAVLTTLVVLLTIFVIVPVGILLMATGVGPILGFVVGLITLAVVAVKAIARKAAAK